MDLASYMIIREVVCAMILIFLMTELARAAIKHFGTNETITNFLRSVVICIAVFNMSFNCMVLLGFDSKTLMSASTIVGMIAAIGSKKIMSNLLAGVFIAVEELIRPFDFLIVKKCAGLVVDSNLFYVTLEDGDENRTKIHSKDFTVFNNMSFNLSTIYIDAKVSAKLSYKKAEEFVGQVLENSDEKFPTFVVKPEFLGIEKFKGGRMYLRFMGRCKGKDRKKAIVSLTLQVAKAFAAGGGELLYSQIEISK